MRTTLILPGTFLLFGVLALGQAPRVDSAATPVRSQKGKPLSALLEPGQTELLVEKDQSAPHYVEPPPGMSQLEWMASVAPVVAVVRVELTEPALTTDQDWMQTTVRVRVEEVLKKPAGDVLNPGDLMEFIQDSGEMHISGTRVRATLPWTESFREGTRYLVFAQRQDTGKGWLIDPAVAYEIGSAHETLRPLARRGTARSEAGISIGNASTRIRAVSRKQHN